LDWIKLIFENENVAIKLLYDSYRSEVVDWLHTKYNLTTENSIDIFQQSVVLIYDKIISGKITNDSGNVKTYLFGICKNKALSLLRASKKENEFKQDYKIISTNPEINDENLLEDKLKLVEKSLMKIGSPCKNILKLFYYYDYNMEQICQELGYKNVNTTKNLKYKCLKRLQSMVFDIYK